MSGGKVSWTSVAIIFGLPTLLSFIAWLIAILSNPVRWCSVQVTGSKVASSTISDCTSIVLSLIHWLGWTCIGLVACVVVAFLVIVTRDLKAGLDIKGPGGIALHTGGEDAARTEGAKIVADQAVETAKEVAGVPTT